MPFEIPLSQEKRFLLAWLRFLFGEAPPGACRGGGEPEPDWGGLTDLIHGFQTGPLLGGSLPRGVPSGWPRPPQALRQAIRAAYVKTLFLNQACLDACLEISEALRDCGIAAVFLKGMHLAFFVYPDPGLRPMADVDILIPRDALPEVEARLLTMGYALPSFSPEREGTLRDLHGIPPGVDLLDWFRSSYKHLGFGHASRIEKLEVHWSLGRREDPLDGLTERFLSRARTVCTGGRRLCLLRPEDLLLHLAVHESHDHRFQLFGLRPLCDIAWVLVRHGKEICWEGLWDEARTWGLAGHLSLVLECVRRLLGVTAPPPGPSLLEADLPPEEVAEEALRRLLKEPAEASLPRGLKYMPNIQGDSQGRFGLRRLRFFFERIPISRKDLAERYGTGQGTLVFLAGFLRRLLTLIVAYGRVYGASWGNRILGRETQSLDLWIARGGQHRRASSGR